MGFVSPDLEAAGSISPDPLGAGSVSLDPKVVGSVSPDLEAAGSVMPDLEDEHDRQMTPAHGASDEQGRDMEPSLLLSTGSTGPA